MTNTMTMAMTNLNILLVLVLLIIGDKILIVTCLVLFTGKELLDDRLQLRTEIFAMEPALKENLGAAVDKIPDNGDKVNDHHSCNGGECSPQSVCLEKVKVFNSMRKCSTQRERMVRRSAVHLNPSVSSCSLSLSTTKPTVSAPLFGECGIL